MQESRFTIVEDSSFALKMDDSLEDFVSPKKFKRRPLGEISTTSDCHQNQENRVSHGSSSKLLTGDKGV